MIITITEPDHFSATALATLQSIGTVELGPVDREGLLRAARRSTALFLRLGHDIDRQVIAAGRDGDLRYVVSPTTGRDHIDLRAAEEAGIEVLTLFGERAFLDTVHSTAEHSLGLLLSLTRSIPAAARSVTEGHWDRDAFRGIELAGRTIGILGLGRVGCQIARFTHALDMEVVGFDPDPYAPRLSDVPVVRLPTLLGLLQRAQILSIHVDLNPGTVGLIGADEIAALPPGAWIVNTSRGEVLDSSAVAAAVLAGHLAGVAADVLPTERDPAARITDPLVTLAQDHPQRVVLTPHIAGATWDAMHRTEEFMADRLRSAVGPDAPD